MAEVPFKSGFFVELLGGFHHLTEAGWEVTKPKKRSRSKRKKGRCCSYTLVNKCDRGISITVAKVWGSARFQEFVILCDAPVDAHKVRVAFRTIAEP